MAKKQYGIEPSDYTKTYTSFSGHDMVCIFEIPVSTTESVSSVIGTLQTITYSVHNDKMPVRVLGNMNARSFVFNGRIIAGSMIFTVFDRHWAKLLLDKYAGKVETDGKHFLADELPGINCTITFANEYGQKACLRIYGITFVNEGQVMSINDIITENTFEYYAKDVEYLDNVEDSSPAGTQTSNDLSALAETQAQEDSESEVLDVPMPEGNGDEEDDVTETKTNTQALSALETKIAGCRYPFYFGDYKNLSDYKTAVKAVYKAKLQVISQDTTASKDEKNRLKKVVEEGYKTALGNGKEYFKRQEEKSKKTDEKGSGS